MAISNVKRVFYLWKLYWWRDKERDLNNPDADHWFKAEKRKPDEVEDLWQAKQEFNDQ